MKKIFIIHCLIVSALFVQSQIDWGTVNFDDTTWVNYVFIDTINYPDNIWQIGSPEKIIFDESYSLPNSIVTDTINSYPINNISVFTVRYISPNPPMGDWEITAIQFIYQIDADQDTDFGKLEFSTDNGQTWIDYLTDTLFNYCYNSNNTYSFTGSSPEWQYFSLEISPQFNCFNIQPGDTIWYKFTFVSDDMQSGRDGWMIDNIQLWDIYEGIYNNSVFNTYINIYPNPAQDYIVFELSGKSSSMADNKPQILITNSYGQPITQIPVTGNKTIFDCRHLPPGIYFYQYRMNEKSYSGKFLITR
jgi:hypothetical protein